MLTTTFTKLRNKAKYYVASEIESRCDLFVSADTGAVSMLRAVLRGTGSKRAADMSRWRFDMIINDSNFSSSEMRR